MPRTPDSRRRFLRQAGLAAAGVALSPRVGRTAASASATAPADAWPQFRGTPSLSGLSATTLADKLSVAWEWEAGDAIESSAAIVAGVVYVGTRAGELVALELASGKLVWRYKVTGDGIGESSACVAGGAVFVGDLGGQLHAVDAVSGKGLWTYKTGQEIKSSPVVVEGRVLVGSYDQSLYSFDARSGRLAWKLETEGPVHATPSVDSGTTYVSGCDEVLRAIRIADGTELFQVASGGYTGASAALAAGRAFYGTFENQVLAVDLVARQLAWRFEHPERKFPFYSSAALPEGRVVLGGRDKLVHCLDAATGASRWTYATRARVDSSPAVAGGRVYVGSSDGRLYVLDPRAAGSCRSTRWARRSTASPALAAGRLVIGSEDGVVVCFR